MVLLANDGAWQGATNFLKSPVADNPEGHCWRYDSIATRLNADEGNINAASAFELLEEASQANTQWSIVYGMNDLDISVAMGRDFDIIHQFELEAD